MSSTYLSHQFQAPEQIEAADRPEQPPQQPSVEKPIEQRVPPQPQPTPTRQHARQKKPPKLSTWSPMRSFLSHSPLNAHLRQTGLANQAHYPGRVSLQPVYHTLDPEKLPPLPSSGGAEGQAQEPQSPGSQSGAIRGDASDADSDDRRDDAGGADGPPKQIKTPLVQPITPLQYPSVRLTLLLGPYETSEAAIKAAIEYAVAQGYMLHKKACNRAQEPGTRYARDAPITGVDLACDRAGACKNEGTGKRKRQTHKLGCPARVLVTCRKRYGSKWFIDPRCEAHNHDLQPGNMESNANYRRWRRQQEASASAEAAAAAAVGETQKNAAPQPPPLPTGPLHMAAFKGQTAIMRILINSGADIDALDSTGRTALHCALDGSSMDAVRLLVERGASVTRADAKGLSPLHAAVQKGMEDAVLLLLERGADPNK